MVTENQAWMFSPRTSTTQNALQRRLAEQARNENLMRLAGDMLQEDIRTNAAAGGSPWIPRSTTTPTQSGGGGTTTPRGGGLSFNLGGSGEEEEERSINVNLAGDGKNVDQLRAMYASAMAELQRQQTEGGQTVRDSISRMLRDPMNNANAYAALQAQAPNVVGNPLAEYAEATGISTDMANKSQQLANADAQAYQNAVQNVYNIMSASQQGANDTRMADIGMIETGANQDLATQANMLKLLLNQRETADVIALQQRNMENIQNQRNVITQQIQSIFGNKIKPEELFKLVEATLEKINNQWGSGATV